MEFGYKNGNDNDYFPISLLRVPVPKFYLFTVTVFSLGNYNQELLIVKLGSRSKVYLKSLRDLDLELDSIIAMSPTTHPENFSEQNNIEISSCMN